MLRDIDGFLLFGLKNGSNEHSYTEHNSLASLTDAILQNPPSQLSDYTVI